MEEDVRGAWASTGRNSSRNSTGLFLWRWRRFVGGCFLQSDTDLLINERMYDFCDFAKFGIGEELLQLEA